MNVLNLILQYLLVILFVVGVIVVIRSKIIQGVLKNGIQVVWKKKYLWFIAAFAGLATYGGEANFFANRLDAVSSFTSLINAINDAVVKSQAQHVWTVVKRVYSSAPGLMSMWVLGALLFVMAIVWIILMSQGALTRIVGRFMHEQSASFFDGVATAGKRFWDIVKVTVIFFLIGWGFWLLVTGLPAILYFATKNDAWKSVAQIGAYFSVVVSAVNLFLLQYAFLEMLVWDEPAIIAIRKAWGIFREHTLLSIELALALFIVNLVVLVQVAAVLVVFVFPGNIPTLVFDILVLFLELGLLTTFSYGATAALYIQMRQGHPVGMLSTWTEKIVNMANKRSAV